MKIGWKALLVVVPCVLRPIAALAVEVPQVDIHGVIAVTKPATRVQGFDFPAQRTRMIRLPNGTQIPLREFMRTYCQGNYTDETCARGTKILSIDSSSGPREQLPAGL